MFVAMQAQRKTHKGDSKGAFVRLDVKLLNGADVILQLVRNSALLTTLPCQPSTYMAGCAFLLILSCLVLCYQSLSGHNDTCQHSD